VRKAFRVVIDTNHIMSAILSAGGASAKLIAWMTREEGYFRLLISQPIWDEYHTVADWLIPQTKQDEKERVLRVLLAQSEWIVPEIRLSVCSDPSDNCFLECAVAGGADYLVTKNIRHFPRKAYAGVKIVRIRTFLQALEQTARDNPQALDNS
jgi:putative PIN family toxin of toxin-antitoxin system